MKVVVAMAGRGSRLANAQLDIPKPLLSVAGRPMIEWALQSLKSVTYTQIIFVALAEHERRFGLTNILQSMAPGQMKVLLLDAVTEGQLCTVLAARAEIDSDEDLLIASSDTCVVSDIGLDIARRREETRGIISVAHMPGDRWSFARVDEAGEVIQVAEKSRISDLASTGLYYFASGTEFVSIADEVINRREKTSGEYYVMPVYHRYIETGRSIRISLAREMADMGTPESLREFERRQTAEQRAAKLC